MDIASMNDKLICRNRLVVRCTHWYLICLMHMSHRRSFCRLDVTSNLPASTEHTQCNWHGVATQDNKLTPHTNLPRREDAMRHVFITYSANRLRHYTTKSHMPAKVLKLSILQWSQKRKHHISTHPLTRRLQEMLKPIQTQKHVFK